MNETSPILFFLHGNIECDSTAGSYKGKPSHNSISFAMKQLTLRQQEEWRRDAVLIPFLMEQGLQL